MCTVSLGQSRVTSVLDLWTLLGNVGEFWEAQGSLETFGDLGNLRRNSGTFLNLKGTIEDLSKLRGNLRGTFGGPSGHLQGSFGAPSGSLQGSSGNHPMACIGPKNSISTTTRQPKLSIAEICLGDRRRPCGTFGGLGEPSENIRGPSGNLRRPSGEHSGNS